MMSKGIGLVVAGCLVVVLLSGKAFGESFKFWASDDAWVNEANPAANYGNSSYLSVKDSRGGGSEAYLRFSSADLERLTGYSVISAQLGLYQYISGNTAGDDFVAHRIIQDWQESLVKWDNPPAYESSGVGLNIAGGSAGFAGQWREWNGLGDFVSLWAGGNNYGLSLENWRDGKADELFARFYSSEAADPELRPYLRVEAVPLKAAPEPISAALFLLGSGAMAIAAKIRKN